MFGSNSRFHHTSPQPRRNNYSSSNNNNIHGDQNGPSNLERFIDSTTPSVPARYPPKMERSFGVQVAEQPYFLLRDLWEQFEEWSVYGAGVPLVLNERNAVVQYYVPYLSAIQLYCEERRCPGSARRSGEESDIDSSRDSSSDSSSDWELERGINGLSPNKHTSLSDGSFSDDSEAGNDLGHLLFEYFEQDAPYSRIPLADKISNLTSRFPDLKTLKSCDLLPTSWISVAWYPIYRIPTGPTLRDLDACFLTFHSLSTPLGGCGSIPSPIITQRHGTNDMLPLGFFGLASYKFKTCIWTPRGGCQRQLMSSLQQSADNWVRLRKVNHPDHQFFTSRGISHRSALMILDNRPSPLAHPRTHAGEWKLTSWRFDAC